MAGVSMSSHVHDLNSDAFLDPSDLPTRISDLRSMILRSPGSLNKCILCIRLIKHKYKQFISTISLFEFL